MRRKVGYEGNGEEEQEEMGLSVEERHGAGFEKIGRWRKGGREEGRKGKRGIVELSIPRYG